MNMFANWIAKKGVAKSYPKVVAECYVEARGKRPEMNIFDLLFDMIKRNQFGWSLSADKKLRSADLLKHIAYSEHNPSDYRVLLKYCTDLPYIINNRKREETPQRTRNAYFQASLEGLNEGLGSFLFAAKSLYTTTASDDLEQDPNASVEPHQSTSSSSR